MRGNQLDCGPECAGILSGRGNLHAYPREMPSLEIPLGIPAVFLLPRSGSEPIAEGLVPNQRELILGSFGA